jgi:apolipoprotein N-acyltransferase
VAAAQSSGFPQSSRVAKNIQILGILWIVVSFLHLIPAAGMIFFGTVGFSFLARPKLGFLMPFVGALGVLIAITAVAGLLVGWGLIDRRPWARMLAIIFGCLKLLDIPFGTALGIYTLWVLASEGAEAEYQRMARVS